MKGKGLCIAALLLCLLCQTPTNAEEIKYAFTKGAVYSYKYSRQNSSVISASTFTPQKSSDNLNIEFNIKVVGFQDNAFILDIGNSEATYRRYLSPNGSLKGSPSEDRLSLPFFITFPEGDWRIGSTTKQNTEVLAYGKKIPVVWTLTLTNIDTLKSLADISFQATFGIEDNRFFSRKMALQGKLVFNMAEGVIHPADWSTQYIAKLITKEIAITRDLWNIEKKTNHTLVMTGVQK